MGWTRRHFDNLREENEQWRRELAGGRLSAVQRDNALDCINVNEAFIRTFEGSDGYDEPDRT